MKIDYKQLKQDFDAPFAHDGLNGITSNNTQIARLEGVSHQFADTLIANMNRVWLAETDEEVSETGLFQWVEGEQFIKSNEGIPYVKMQYSNNDAKASTFAMFLIACMPKRFDPTKT